MNLLKGLFSTGTSNLTAVEAQERIQSDQPPFLLDVRQPDEYRASHVPGSTLIPLNQLPGRLNELPRNRDILCICRSGSRSGVATRQLNSAGFTALNLTGGMIGWTRAGLPVRKGDSR